MQIALIYVFSGCPPSPGKGRGGVTSAAQKRQLDVATTQDFFVDQHRGDRWWCRDFGSSEIGMSRYYARDVTVVMSLFQCDPPATILPKFSLFYVSNDVSIVETMTATATFSPSTVFTNTNGLSLCHKSRWIRGLYTMDDGMPTD